MKIPRSFRFLPYILTVVVFISIAWSIWFQIRQPSLGFSLTLATGKVISTTNDFSDPLKAGDSIRSIDGVLIDKVSRFPSKNAGEYQRLIVDRDGRIFTFDLLLDKPTVFDLIERLSPIFAALLFLILGIGVYSFLRPEGSSVSFFIYCIALSIILAAGADSAFGLPIARKIFGGLLWWIGPLALHTYFQLISTTKSSHEAKRLPIFYGLALFFCTIYLWPGSAFPPSVRNVLFYVEYFWLAINLCILVTVLLLVHRSTKIVETRRKIGIIFFSFVIGIAPFLLLSLLPELFFSQVILPYEITLFFLVTIPAGYGLAILRYKFIALDHYVDRTTTKALLILLILFIYGFTYLSISRLFPGTMNGSLLSGLATTLLLIITYPLLSQYLRRFVDKILYGGWYDEKEIIKHVNLTLDQSLRGPDEIAESLCQALQQILQLEYVNFLFPDGRLINFQDESPRDNTIYMNVQQASAEYLFNYLNRLSPHGIGDSLISQESINLQDDAKRNIFGNRPQLWFILKSKTENLGLLILGSRRGGEFEQIDLTTLEVVTRQASYALDNATLLTQVQRHARKVQALNAQMTVAREEERKRLSRELHDQTLQSLYGLKYHVFNLKSNMSNDRQDEVDILQKELQNTAERIRTICAELRPPALDSHGLVPAIRDHVRKTSRFAGFQITFEVDEEEIPPISSEVSIILFRVLQECLTNIQKHALAQHVQVRLNLQEGQLVLRIADDGRGFIVPDHLEQFTTTEHFGLAGAQERLNPLGGCFQIRSSPGQGCQITASIPLEPTQDFVMLSQEDIHGVSPDHRG